MNPSTPISTFLRNESAKPISIDELISKGTINVNELSNRTSELYPVVHVALQENRSQFRNATSKGILPNFTEGDFVLVARDNFTAGENLSLRWNGPRRVVKVLSNYAFEVENLRNGTCEIVHGTRIKFYHDSSLDTEAVI